MGAWACSAYGPEGKYLYPRWRWARWAALLLLAMVTGISAHSLSSMRCGILFYWHALSAGVAGPTAGIFALVVAGRGGRWLLHRLAIIAGSTMQNDHSDYISETNQFGCPSAAITPMQLGAASYVSSQWAIPKDSPCGTVKQIGCFASCYRLHFLEQTPTACRRTAFASAQRQRCWPRVHRQH
jgi:hypothetical protein